MPSNAVCEYHYTQHSTTNLTSIADQIDSYFPVECKTNILEAKTNHTVVCSIDLLIIINTIDSKAQIRYRAREYLVTDWHNESNKLHTAIHVVASTLYEIHYNQRCWSNGCNTMENF